ncbi:PleD family two-component system response regulator, partial [Fibrobacterota bacterium]
MKVLVADDEKVALKMIEGALEVLGHEMLPASTGREAMEILEKEYKHIRLLILDWHMPEMNGFEVLQKAKADDRYRHIPVLMQTMESGPDNIRAVMDAGAKHY